MQSAKCNPRTVGHGKNSRSSVLEHEVLVRELVSCIVRFLRGMSDKEGQPKAVIQAMSHETRSLSTYRRWTFHQYRCGW